MHGGSVEPRAKGRPRGGRSSCGCRLGPRWPDRQPDSESRPTGIVPCNWPASSACRRSEVIRSFPADRAAELDSRPLGRPDPQLGGARPGAGAGVQRGGDDGGRRAVRRVQHDRRVLQRADRLARHAHPVAGTGRRLRRREAGPHGRAGDPQLPVLRPGGRRRPQGLPQLRRAARTRAAAAVLSATGRVQGDPWRAAGE